MDRVILLRFGELYLKGKNRGFFEKLLLDSIKSKLSKFSCTIKFGRGRYIVSDYSAENESAIVAALKCVFGLQSLSVAERTKNDFERIFETAKAMCRSKGTFRVNINRADKSFPMSSPEIARELGGRLLDEFPGLEVDLHNPDFTVNVDLREDGYSYVYSDKVYCAGGMPTGSAGKGLLMLSGGIDSPVAGHMIAKRGMSVECLHFHSYPYTNMQAKEKVIELAEVLSRYTCGTTLNIIKVTHIQEEIHKKCNGEYMVTLLRRFMMRIAEKIAIKCGAQCIITGESLGQVASQTIEGMTSSNAVIRTLPVLRPLCGFDKNEIIVRSKAMGAYDISILPYEDCCTVFLPKHPVTKPKLSDVEAEEAKLDVEALVDEALGTLEIVKI